MCICMLAGTILPFPVVDVRDLEEVVPCSIYCVNTYRSMCMLQCNWYLWAIVRTVQSQNSVLRVCWINSSVSMSTAAVASSKIRILFLCSKARPRHTSCRWPTLRKKGIWFKNVQAFVFDTPLSFSLTRHVYLVPYNHL